MQNQPQGGCFFCCLPIVISAVVGAAALISLVVLALTR